MTAVYPIRRTEGNRQSKVTPIRPDFIVRDTPKWLATHQDWISDRARHVYCDMRSLADAKTGRLFIQGRG
jgi:hypothetical protein